MTNLKKKLKINLIKIKINKLEFNLLNIIIIQFNIK